ncbi:MAG: helix-turn-helix transcriptional regulator [Treponema sp.]|nr:helix-turn-helix transcriptional regulator [Treponema sp.]
MSSEFKANLREQLSYLGITVQELAYKSKISKRTIENYLSKRGSIPPADYACRMANVLGVSVEWLVTGNEQKKSCENSEEAKFRPLIKKIASLPAEVRDAIQTLVFATASVVPQTQHHSYEKEQRAL